MFFRCTTACLPCCFAYAVFLPIFSLFTFPINSSRTCSFGAGFQSALLLLSHPANPAAIFFPSQLFCLMLFPRFSSPFSPFLLPPCRTVQRPKATGVICAVPLLHFPFCFLHRFLLISPWKGNNKQRGSWERRQHGHTCRNRKAKVLSDGW